MSYQSRYTIGQDDSKISKEVNHPTGFPGPRAKYYIPLVVGQRSMGLQEYSSRSKVVHLVLRSYCLYGSTVVRKHGSSVMANPIWYGKYGIMAHYMLN